MAHIPIYGWQSYGVSRYRHFCGARILRKEEKWVARFVSGSISSGHKTAKSAIAFIEINDPAFWTFDECTSKGRIAGLWTETAHIDGVLCKDAFTAYLRVGDELPKFVEGVFRIYAFGIATCAKCSRCMDELRFESKMYFGSWYPQTKSGKGWSFVACECGHPVWRGSSLTLEKRLKKAENTWNRQQRVKNAEGHYTPQDISNILALQESRCLYCDVEFSDDKSRRSTT